MTDNFPDNTLLLNIVAHANDFCILLQNAASYEKQEFVEAVLASLPALYSDFAQNDIPAIEENERYFSSYIDEDYYESIRRQVEMVMGPDDVFLETFEEDMKYSDTPIAASISEGLADIFQDLFNFTSIVKDTEGDELRDAFIACKENFVAYWSQTLCNVMRPLNHLRYHPSAD